MWAILYDFLSQSFSKRREQAEKFWSLTKRLPISMPVVVFLFLKMVLHFLCKNYSDVAILYYIIEEGAQMYAPSCVKCDLQNNILIIVNIFTHWIDLDMLKYEKGPDKFHLNLNDFVSYRSSFLQTVEVSTSPKWSFSFSAAHFTYNLVCKDAVYIQFL